MSLCCRLCGQTEEVFGTSSLHTGTNKGKLVTTTAIPSYSASIWLIFIGSDAASLTCKFLSKAGVIYVVRGHAKRFKSRLSYQKNASATINLQTASHLGLIPLTNHLVDFLVQSPQKSFLKKKLNKNLGRQLDDSFVSHINSKQTDHIFSCQLNC